MERLSGLSRTRKVFFAILAVALLLMSVFWLFGIERPFGGQFDDVGFVEVDGSLDRVVLFCFNNDCKFLWQVTVERSELRSGELVASLPETGDILSVDVTDSRANLFVNLRPIDCYRDVDGTNSSPVRTCEYEVSQREVTLSILEEIGSSGQPEWSGVPR